MMREHGELQKGQIFLWLPSAQVEGNYEKVTSDKKVEAKC